MREQEETRAKKTVGEEAKPTCDENRAERTFTSVSLRKERGRRISGLVFGIIFSLLLSSFFLSACEEDAGLTPEEREERSDQMDGRKTVPSVSSYTDLPIYFRDENEEDEAMKNLA